MCIRDSHESVSHVGENIANGSFEENNFNGNKTIEAIGTATRISEELSEGELEISDGFDPSILNMEREQLLETVDDSQLLDAYYAEFGDSTLAALMNSRPELKESLSEVVIGRDDRIRVGATNKNPWRWICSLRITAKDGSRWIGTGWLAGPRTVITAGHVVYMHSRGCLLYTSPSPRDRTRSRMPSSA